MGRLLAPLAVCAALISLAHAGIEFTKPKAGETLKAGTAIEVEWKEGGDGPALSDLTTFELHLCFGGNDADTIVPKLAITTAGQFSAGNKAQGMVGTDVGADKPANAYFLRIVATAKTGGTLQVYSPRFSYSGMTGEFPDGVITAMKSVKGTSGPSSVDNTAKEGEAVDPNAELFDVEYTMQTGPTRFAPMQPVPPTKITKKTATPQHSTSSVDIARTILPIPSIQTTITQSQTHKVSSMANTVAAAPNPSDDMAKFLARWKD
ncbi:hypothetical protein K458DRAFT_418141 [Lentithecium fluviatile CBS 122367]|uniref:Uncharacterized protein n=1 Tax=Lentithecium fluviatile CBS 122367 TaxID=1168545 RepID=A0A6G1J2Y2_9PLEO|nr:hypothetical protein K458DRAFT_418141 [Lentithecium fluviatile CBS 122367]